MNNVAGSFSAVSVFLFFLGIAFEYFRAKYDKVINELPILEKPALAEEYRKRKRVVIALGSVICTVVFCFFWILLPTAVQIFRASRLELWNFDLLRTLFVFVTFLVLILFLVTAILTLNVAKKLLNYPKS